MGAWFPLVAGPRTKRPSVREPGINGEYEPIDKAQNSGSSANSREIPVIKDPGHVRPRR